MRLGFVSAILPELSLDQVLAFASAHQFSCVEAMCWPVGKAERKFAGVTHVDVTEFSPGQVDEVRESVARHGVELSALGYYPNVLCAEKEDAARQIEHLKKVIATAAKLGLGTVNTFIGNDHRLPLEENFVKFLTVWPDLIRFAEDHGVRIGIENCAMYFTADEWPSGKNMASSPKIWRRMFAAIDSPNFGLNYDPSHLVWMQMDWLKPITEFRDKLFHVHAKDVRIDRQRLDDVGILAHPLEYHQPRIPGFGEVDWGRFLGTLQAVGYAGPVCIEVEDDTFGKTLEGRQRAVRAAGNVLRPFFG